MKNFLYTVLVFLLGINAFINMTAFSLESNKNQQYINENEKTIAYINTSHGLGYILAEADGYHNVDNWIKDYKYHQNLIDNKIEELHTQNLTTEQALQIQNLQYNAITANSIYVLQDILNTLNTIIPSIQEEKNINNNSEIINDTSTTVEAQPQESYNYSTSSFKYDGVTYLNDTRYTWYSQNVLPGGGLNIPGRHVGDNELIYDEDGYVVVASNDYSYKSVVDTPFGEGKVYDSGCPSGTIDIYTDF